MAAPRPKKTLGRYALFDEFAYGGMASIHLGRQIGALGFSRVVALKRLHPPYAREPEFVSGFLDEARLAARIRHECVVPTLDVVHLEGAAAPDGEQELVLVMDYVDGESLAALTRQAQSDGTRLPRAIAVRIAGDALRGLHAAHEATQADGSPLGIVHRDVSPQNLLVGADGVTRVVDFGIALANVRLQTTRAGDLKGKPAYMAPEQLTGGAVTRQADVFGVGLVLWELLASRRAYQAANEAAALGLAMACRIPSLAARVPDIEAPLAAVVNRALARDPAERFASASDMLVALHAAHEEASRREVGEWLERAMGAHLQARRQLVRAVELFDTDDLPPPSAQTSTQPLPAATLSNRGAPRSERLQIPSERAGETLTVVPGVSTRKAARVSRWALASGAVLLLGIALLAWRFGGAQVEPEAGPVSSALELASVAEAEPSAPAAAATPPALAPTPSASSSASEAPAAALGRGKLPPTRPSAAPAGSSACDPPYFIDADGIRRVKRNCLK